jgi:hypothetical protein
MPPGVIWQPPLNRPAALRAASVLSLASFTIEAFIEPDAMVLPPSASTPPRGSVLLYEVDRSRLRTGFEGRRCDLDGALPGEQGSGHYAQSSEPRPRGTSFRLAEPILVTIPAQFGPADVTPLNWYSRLWPRWTCRYSALAGPEMEEERRQRHPRPPCREPEAIGPIFSAPRLAALSVSHALPTASARTEHDRRARAAIPRRRCCRPEMPRFPPLPTARGFPTCRNGSLHW